MNHKVEATIEKYRMLSAGDRVMVAFSGGADSAALLDLLSAGGLSFPLTVRACHLNHQLRGEESERDEQFVRTMCAQYGVELIVERADIKQIAKTQGISIELAARHARYAFFDRLAKDYHCKIATAHTQSDTVETVLFHMTRGTGLTGLCGIPPMREGDIIRPLIACSRQDIEAYCQLHSIWYVTDSSNLADDYSRNYIRHHVVPHLAYINPELGTAVTRMTETLRQDADFFEQQVAQLWASLYGAQGILLSGLREQHPAIRTRLIQKLLAQHEIARSAQRITLIDDMVTGKLAHQVLQVEKYAYITVNAGYLSLQIKTPQKKEQLKTISVRKEQLDGATFSIGCGKSIRFAVVDRIEYEIFENNLQYLLNNAIDYDKMSFDVFIRPRQAGDKLEQAGRGIRKPLKKLFNELALPDRDARCIIADNQGVCFAEGAGVDERVKVTGVSQKMITFEILRQNVEDTANDR